MLPTPPPSAALALRRLTLHDLPHCLELAENRGWFPDRRLWTLLLTAGTGYGIDDPRGGLRAVCVSHRYGPEERPGLTVLSMLLVSRDHAGQGLGRRLLSEVIAQEPVDALALYASDERAPLYEDLGFRTAATGNVETLEGHFTGAGAIPGVRVRRATAGDLRALLDVDREIFGLDRTPLLARLPAFADRMSLAEDAEGQVLGFAALRTEPHAALLGPLVAREPVLARALVADLVHEVRTPVRIVVENHQEELRDWLTGHGLRSVFHSRLMLRGAPALPGNRFQRYAPLSTATG
ncbi:GNAT family N-acetyltransferase [Streptomyces sp. AM 3-1-1]|uniref:GNAT family N-acetyltransferase n=1 Tax=Streptomyces sp. AM 3-1-1 TaxID=3028711 RepID=UPI0023B9B744|nr:GNAT family N-acetyltransferase [Streptomyces sp. AM 3-1-1]WEH28593.1 GNAT family N-acetyltransferase [Streptomyces sp. AM 3-1-1]